MQHLRWRGFLSEESNWEEGREEGRPASGDSSGRREVRDRQRQKEERVNVHRWRSQWLQLRPYTPRSSQYGGLITNTIKACLAPLPSHLGC